MCGIAGLYNVPETAERKSHAIRAMTDSLRHRGPDGGQIFIDNNVALGHRRLSIIAPVESANQPMRRGPLVIVYNGELYNYREEKERLQSIGTAFHTESDTEVILALYESEGTSCFKRLNGIFAFAIYDERTGRLVCARDHLGIKPFLYAERGKGILFASELKSLLSSSMIERSIDQEALYLLLQTGSVPQPHTMVKDIKALMPGHFMTCGADGIKIERYYSMSPAKISLSSDIEWQEYIHECLIRSIKDQLVSDVPVGAFLSGGVDSGLIAALMREHSSQVKTYSVGFENSQTAGQYDETTEAESVAAYLGTDHQTLIVSDSEAKDLLPQIIYGLDHPTIDGLNSFFVSKVTSSHVRVALSGTGADEIFAGYSWFEQMRSYENANFINRIKYKARGQSAEKFYASLHGAFPARIIDNLLADRLSKRPSRAIATNIPGSHGIKRTSDLVIGTFLQNQLLPDIDTASMFHGLEVRVPYLSINLVESSLALPDHLKLGASDPKAPARSYAANGTKKILVDIARTYLPSGFDLRPKRGFAMPMERWMNSIWKDQMDETTSSNTIKQRGIFDEHQLSNLVGQGRLPWTWTWLLMSIELWCRNVLDERPVT